LVAEVEGLPLALVLLAERLRRLSSLSVSELRLELAEPELGAKAVQIAHAELMAKQGLVASQLSSWRTLAPEAMELARLLSLTLSPPIPREQIQRCESPGQRWHDALADRVGANLLDRLAGEPVRYALQLARGDDQAATAGGSGQCPGPSAATLWPRARASAFC